MSSLLSEPSTDFLITSGLEFGIRGGFVALLVLSNSMPNFVAIITLSRYGFNALPTSSSLSCGLFAVP